MSLTFTSWTACNDASNPTLVWGSVADVRGRLAWRYLEAIRQAIVERDGVAGRGVPAALVSPLTDGQLFDPVWAGWVDNEVFSLIPYFANHTDNGGAWDGQTTCAPAWSEAALMADIGAARLPALAAYGLPSAAWVQQKYEVLRRLRWRQTAAEYATFDAKGGQYVSTPWAAAVAAFDGAAWASDYPPGGSYPHPQHTSYRSSSVTPNILRHRGTTRPATAYSIASDWQLYVQHAVQYPGSSVFEQPDYPYTEGQHQLWQSGSAAAGTQPASSAIADLSTCTVSNPPVDGIHYGYKLVPLYVSKYNVPGGFTFQDS